MPDEIEGRPIFGQPPERGRGRSPNPPIKGQRRAGLEKQLPPPIERKVPKALARRRRLTEVKKREAERTDWQELVLSDGVKIPGRFYQLTEGVDTLGLFPVPPRIEHVNRFANLKGGDWVFVRKGSWESNNPLRKGWAEVFVLAEARQEGNNPRIKTFDDHGFTRSYGFASHQGIIDRQVVGQNVK